MEKQKEHPWIKLKKYPHIGLPLKRKDISMLENYITDNSKIANHSFLPFLHRTIFQRKFRANKSDIRNEKSNRRQRVKSKPKVREIYFASHFDAQIYSYYSFLLSKNYNKLLKTKNFDKSVVAYRKMEKEDEKGKHKCNIDFALEAFQFIKDNDHQELSVIVADVTKFFDSLDHKVLKQKWAQVWNNSKTLPDDHYRVYKSLIKMSYVNEDLLFRKYKKRILVSTKLPNDTDSTILRQKNIKHKRFLKDNNAVAFCRKNEFYKNSVNLISKTSNTKGIPQGTALSATLANIYMLDFDEEVQDYIDKDEVKGFYQRYSDDLIIVVPREKQDEAISLLRTLIRNKVKLEIHPDKTKVYHFERANKSFVGYEVDEQTGEKKNKSLEYLGFEFDGQRALIKTAGYSKFYRSMKSSFKRATSLAINSKSSDDTIYKNALYKRFTFKGAKRRQVFSDKSKSYHYDWGNYLSYVEKANKTFKEFNNSDAIRRQSRKNWNYFHDLMNKSLKEIETHKKSRKN